MSYLQQADIPCPWCGEVFSTSIDTSQGDYTAIEDCAVCCQPIALTIACSPGEVETIDAARA